MNKIIVLIKGNPKITLTEIAKAIWKCKKIVQRTIAALDKIVRIGGAKNGYWKIEE